MLSQANRVCPVAPETVDQQTDVTVQSAAEIDNMKQLKQLLNEEYHVPLDQLNLVQDKPGLEQLHQAAKVTVQAETQRQSVSW